MASEDSGLIWIRPQPGSRRPKFTREQIAAAALAIADEEGFAAVSMRRIASELGSGTMTLYYYVRTKDELLAVMDDAIMADVLIPAEEFPDHWYEALLAVGQRTWDVLMRHPWALLSLQSVPPGPNAMRHGEQTLAAVAGIGLSTVDRFALMAMVDDYVHGNVLRSAELNPAGQREPDPAELGELMEFSRSMLATGEFPELTAIFGDGNHPDPRGTESPRERFRNGLVTLLDGVAARMGLPLPGA